MDKTKASQIVGLLISQDFEPNIKRDNANPPNFTVTVATENGVEINQLKQFQDNNGVICKARVVEIT
jgi:hypothetical protein